MRSARGAIPEISYATPDHRQGWLFAKFREELAELAANPTTEEFADVLQVFYDLAHALNIDFYEITKARLKKLHKLRGFRNGVILENIVEPAESQR